MCGQLRMRCILVLFITMGMLLGITTTVTATPVVVTFPDANLEAAVRDTLGIPTAPITDKDMETLLELDANQKGISNIQGLEYATNMYSLGLGGNQISDISAVAGLTKLTNLGLYGNPISDIAVIAGLTNLSELVLGDDQVNDISPVAGLTNLTWLYLGESQISDISAVAGLTNLTDLWLYDNPITDVSAVSGLINLRTLLLVNNDIETLNLSGADFPSLRYFSIENNPLTKVLLVDATLNQASFNALMNGQYELVPPLMNYNGIAKLAGVSTLDMSGVDFSDISDLSKMYRQNGMDDLEKLLLSGACNLDGSKVVTLTEELDSLNWLDVTGLWESFDAGSRSSLNAWDAIEGNTLVIPEPAVLSMLSAMGVLALLRKWQR